MRLFTSILSAVSILAVPMAEAIAQGKEPVTIGMITALSPPGDVALGQLARRGAELGIVYVNEVMGGVLDGRPLQLSIQDSQSRPEAGVAAYRRLVSQDNAVAVTGLTYSSEAIAINEVAATVGVPTFATQAGAKDVTAKHVPVAFRAHGIDPLKVEAWLDWIEASDFKRVAILAETTDFGLGLANETEEQAAKRGLDVEFSVTTFDRTVQDLTPQLLQIKAFEPDLLLNCATGQGIDLIVNQAATIGLTPDVPMLISYDPPIRPQWWQLHPDNGLVHFVAYYSPQQKLSPIGDWYMDAYFKKYAEYPLYTDLTNFGSIVVLAQAINQAKSSDPAAIVQALETGTFDTWSDDKVTFPKADGPYWHNWSPKALILKYTEPGQDWRTAEIVNVDQK